MTETQVEDLSQCCNLFAYMCVLVFFCLKDFDCPNLCQRYASKGEPSYISLKIYVPPFPNSVTSISEFIIFYHQRESYSHTPNQIRMIYDDYHCALMNEWIKGYKIKVKRNYNLTI